MELRIEHMTKQFQDKRAVNDVSLKLTPGVWGLLGANGAGKTTLMRMVAGILQPTKGEIYYDGIEIGTLGAAWRDVFGYLPQEFGFYPEFTVKNYLEYMAALKGLTKTDTKKRIHDLLELLVFLLCWHRSRIAAEFHIGYVGVFAALLFICGVQLWNLIKKGGMVYGIAH